MRLPVLRVQAFFLAAFALFFFVVQTHAYSARLQLRADSLFVGEKKTRKFREKVSLILLERHFFVLRQTFTTSLRSFTRDMTGHWRQREGGATLTLDNAFGFSLRLGVGSENLYGSFPTVAAIGNEFISLHPVAFTKPLFTCMGTLLFSKEDSLYTTLVESATGHIFRVQGEALLQLPRTDKLFVDAEISYDPKISTITKIRSFSHSIPNLPHNSGTVSFSALTKGRIWWLIFPDGEKISLTFTEKTAGKGDCEIAGKGLWVLVAYTQKDAALTFDLSKQNRTMLDLCGYKKLIHILETTHVWERDGSSLILLDGDSEIATLEDAAALPPSVRSQGLRSIIR